MDNLTEKLADILNDPESMNTVREMAAVLLGEKEEKAEAVPLNNSADPLSGEGLPDIGEMQRIMDLFSKIKSANDDPKAQLLTALKPHLGKERQEKVDSALKILKILELLPLIKESGLLNL